MSYELLSSDPKIMYDSDIIDNITLNGNRININRLKPNPISGSGRVGYVKIYQRKDDGTENVKSIPIFQSGNTFTKTESITNVRSDKEVYNASDSIVYITYSADTTYNWEVDNPNYVRRKTGVQTKTFPIDENCGLNDRNITLDFNGGYTIRQKGNTSGIGRTYISIIGVYGINPTDDIRYEDGVYKIPPKVSKVKLKLGKVTEIKWEVECEDRPTHIDEEIPCSGGFESVDFGVNEMPFDENITLFVSPSGSCYQEAYSQVSVGAIHECETTDFCFRIVNNVPGIPTEEITVSICDGDGNSISDDINYDYGSPIETIKVKGIYDLDSYKFGIVAKNLPENITFDSIFGVENLNDKYLFPIQQNNCNSPLIVNRIIKP